VDPLGLAGVKGDCPPNGAGNIDQYQQQTEGSSPPATDEVVTHETSRRRAMSQAQQHAKVRRASKGGQVINHKDLNMESRGISYAQNQADGANNLGRLDPHSKAYYMDHPDGHPHQVGPDFPDHHGKSHVHAVNSKGLKLIITYNKWVIFMTIFMAKEKNLRDNTEIEINTYVAVYQNTTGDIGFDYSIEPGGIQTFCVNLKNAYYFSPRIGVIQDCVNIDFLSAIKMDVNEGAFIFFEPNYGFEQHIADFEKHLSITKKNNLLVRYNKKILPTNMPALNKFYMDSEIDIFEFKKLLSSCTCCFQGKFSEHGIYFIIYTLKPINFSHLFNTVYEFSEPKNLPCWWIKVITENQIARASLLTYHYLHRALI
jgi:hypothetical protein